MAGNSHIGHEFRDPTLEELESVPEIWADDPKAKADLKAPESVR